MSRSLRQDLHTLAGAYALNALPEKELRRFEFHLARCESCVQEVRGLSETTALLGAAAARTPPAGMRRRVLDEAAHTRQLAPAPVPLPLPRNRWVPWGLGLALAACLVVALVLGGVVAEQRRQIEELRSGERQIAAVLAAPDAAYTSAEPGEGISVTVVASESVGQLVFSAHGLEQLHDEDYQLWLTHEDGSVSSAGLLAVGADGVVEPLLAPAPADAEGVAVTVEPAGGSDTPTADPMMAMPIDG